MGAREREKSPVPKTFRSSNNISTVAYNWVIAKYLDAMGTHKIYAI